MVKASLFLGAFGSLIAVTVAAIAFNAARPVAHPAARAAAVLSPLSETGNRPAVARSLLLANATPPSPLPSPSPSAAPAAPAPAAPAPAPAPQRITNWLRSEDGRISVAVGVYNDPTGQAPVPHWESVLDLSMRMVPWYFDGHNPGVFTPMLQEGQGSVLDYWDGGGKLHRFQIVAVRSWYRAGGEPPPVAPQVVAQFQTCRTLDGSIDWIYDAVAV